MNLTLPFPPTTNNLFRNVRGKGRVPTKNYEQWMKRALGELMIQRPARLTGYVSVDLAFGIPDKRRRDLDNLMKAPLDCLVKFGVVEDDSKIIRISARWLGLAVPQTYLGVKPATLTGPLFKGAA
ncbi:MAG: RusA family crossover junction endodeoxyribonuclease [Hyphomicrobiales bacterium]